MKRLALLVLLFAAPVQAQQPPPAGDLYFALFVGNVPLRPIRGVIGRPMTKTLDFPNDGIVLGVITGQKMTLVDVPATATDPDIWRVLLKTAQEMNPPAQAAPKMPTSSASLLAPGGSFPFTLPQTSYTDSGHPTTFYDPNRPSTAAQQQPTFPTTTPAASPIRVFRTGNVWPQTSYLTPRMYAPMVAMGGAFCST